MTISETSGPADELARRPGYLLARLGADSRAAWRAMLAAHGLTVHQAGTLIVLSRLGRTHQRRLAEAIGVDPRNAAGVLAGLTRRGLVAQRPDPDNGRRKQIALTGDGERLVASLRDDGEAVEERFFAGLSSADREALFELLRRLARARARET